MVIQFLNSLSEHGSSLKSRSLNWVVKIIRSNRTQVSHPLPPAPCAHTHIHTHTYSSIYFPPLFRFIGIILSSQRWSTPLSSCHTIQFKTIVSYPLCARHWLRVIRSRGHLGADSSCLLPSHARYLTDYKIPSILPLKYHPTVTRSTSLTILPRPSFWSSSVLTQKNAAAWWVFLPPELIHFHAWAAKDLTMN